MTALVVTVVSGHTNQLKYAVMATTTTVSQAVVAALSSDVAVSSNVAVSSGAVLVTSQW